MASHAARLAGRGAFTAAAALALTGGTASLAFAHEAPQLPAHDLQSGAHQLADAGHVTDLQHRSSDVASSLKEKASSSLPADVVADAGHAVSNTRNDLTHAKDNWSAAAEDGLTADEAGEQLGLMGDDVTHAVDNGKNDLQHWGSKLSSSAPSELPSVLSFG
ncbi:hypothetical protein [Actinomycetospora atypica]|uniref:DUF4142 domain-containing protein n=1 Tax=Actinomycetospora atypica TaxID=1290095 RepID=A0ABV9YFM0_9PSEU